jgi:hypothetical protein
MIVYSFTMSAVLFTITELEIYYYYYYYIYLDTFFHMVKPKN